MPELFKPLDGRVYPRFSGIKTFFRLPMLQTEEDFKRADIAILGLPFDGGASYRPGARFAPERVRALSSLGRAFHDVLGVHIFQKLNIGDAGDSPVTPTDINKTHEQICASVGSLLNHDVIPLMVGGDHSTTIGSMKAVFERFGPFGVVHFDAHTDAYPAAWGCDVHHGTFMRLGHERGWFQKDRVIQIGIRGPHATCDDAEMPNRLGFNMVTVDDVHIRGIEKIKKEIACLGDGPVYVTFDVDCLDPAFAPGTGTPVPGGLSTWQALQLLRAIADLQIVAGDVVEVSPPYDHSDITSLVAVCVLQEFLAAIAKKNFTSS